MPDFTNIGLQGWALIVFLILSWLTREAAGKYLDIRRQRMEEKKDDREAKLEEQKVDEQRGLAGYIELIGELKANQQHMANELKRQSEKHEASVSALSDKYEQAMATLRAEHVACLKAQAESSAKIALLEDEVKGLRQWRHELANEQHVAGLKRALDEKLAES